MRMEPRDTTGWLTEKQVIAETGVGAFTLDRWRREGLVPWDRRFLTFAKGTVTVYPPIAVPMIHRIRALREEIKGFDRRRWALWLEGYPVNIVREIDGRLCRLENSADTAPRRRSKTKQAEEAPANAIGGLKALAEATGGPLDGFDKVIGKGRQRGKVVQPLFNAVRNQGARAAVLDWGFTIGAGLAPAISLYKRSTASRAVLTAIGGGEPPDLTLDVENMSIARLRNILGKATAAEIEQARRDCARIAALAAGAATANWAVIRKVTGLVHQGGPTEPFAHFKRLGELWQKGELGGNRW